MLKPVKMYNFDEVINRKNTNSISYEGWKSSYEHLKVDGAFPFGDDYIRMWVADMDFATPPEIIEAIKERLDKKILGYTQIFDSKYYETLEKWFLEQYHWEINTKEIVISPGVVPALLRLVPLLIKPDENILISTPSYGPFNLAGTYHNRQVFNSKLRKNNHRFEMDFADLEQKIKDPSLNIKLFILCNPHNPTGSVWTKEELYTLGKICLDNNVWIISDEIHCDLLRTGKQHIPLATIFKETDRIVTCTAPSKTFNLAGSLMSNIFIKNESVRKQYQETYHEVLSPLNIAATQAAYSKCLPWLEALKQYLDANFQLLETILLKELPHAKFSIPEATYLAWIDISYYIKNLPNKHKLTEFFIKNAGVVVEDENKFVNHSAGFIRLNIACSQAVLIEGLNKITNSLKTINQ